MFVRRFFLALLPPASMYFFSASSCFFLRSSLINSFSANSPSATQKSPSKYGSMAGGSGRLTLGSSSSRISSSVLAGNCLSDCCAALLLELPIGRLTKAGGALSLPWEESPLPFEPLTSAAFRLPVCLEESLVVRRVLRGYEAFSASISPFVLACHFYSFFIRQFLQSLLLLFVMSC